jgi:predicted metal-binding protein
MSKKIVSLRICKRCGGAGNLLRPTEAKLINFVKCSGCSGKGTKYKVIES